MVPGPTAATADESVYNNGGQRGRRKNGHEAAQVGGAGRIKRPPTPPFLALPVLCTSFQPPSSSDASSCFQNVVNRSVQQAWCWVIILLFCCPILFWLPFVMDSCYEYVSPVCSSQLFIKTRNRAKRLVGDSNAFSVCVLCRYR